MTLSRLYLVLLLRPVGSESFHHPLKRNKGAEFFALLSTLINTVNTVGDDTFSTADLTTLVYPAAAHTQHYGPYASGSTDSGTCGNDWADDLVDWHFTVFFSSDGSPRLGIASSSPYDKH